MKIESKILIVAVIILVVVFVSIQYFGAIAEHELRKESWISCIAGCTERCHFSVADKVRGKTKQESKKILSDEMELYQITEDEIFQEIDRCRDEREKSNVSGEEVFYPYTELLKKD